ncbi:hypothetical protein [Mesobacillus subterraneus]
MNKVQKFNEIHSSEEILFLGNAWDLLSVLTLEKALICKCKNAIRNN